MTDLMNSLHEYSSSKFDAWVISASWRRGFHNALRGAVIASERARASVVPPWAFWFFSIGGARF